MGCKELNFTKEELVNAQKDESLITQPSPNQTQKETSDKIDAVAAKVIKKDERYWFWDWVIGTRVSEKAKRKKGFQASSVNPDNDIKRETGTFVHEILNDLLQLRANKVGDYFKIKEKALRGPIKLTDAHLSQLNKLAERVARDIRKQQDMIDKEKDVIIKTEIFVGDFLRDIGGTIDVLAIFSDNTGAIYDYKTSGKNDPIEILDGKARVVRRPLPYQDIDAYHIAMSEYKRILLERYGLKYLRQNRLLPIAMSFVKKEGKIERGNTLKREVDNLVAIDESTENLKPIPVGGERTSWAGINKLVEKQYMQIEELRRKLKDKKVSQDEKEEIKRKIDAIDKSITRTLVDSDIYDIIQTVTNLANEVANRLDAPALLDHDQPNPLYLSLEDISDYMSELNVYKDMAEETQTYFQDIKDSDPEKFLRLKKALNRVRPYFEDQLFRLKYEYNNRAESEISDNYKDENGHLLPLQELNFGQLKFLKISEIDHPVYQTVWKVVEDAQFKIKKKFEAMDKNVYGKTEALFKWAKQYFPGANYRNKAFEMLIDKETGNLYSMLKKGFVSELNAVIEKGGSDAIEMVKEHYEFKNEAQWKKDYATRLEGFKAVTKARYNINQATGQFEDVHGADDRIIQSAIAQEEAYEKEISNFKLMNDLENSGVAWLNIINRRSFLKLKESTIKDNYSEEYKKIKAITPLNNFYTMWNDYMEEFAQIFGVMNYRELPPNFIPNIRKEMIEHINSDGFHLMSAVGEFFDSFSVREEDIYLNSYSPDGIERKIPILFMNKFRDKDDKIDNTRKSYDLSTSLMIFGKMAYNYQHMHEIEPKINALKHVLGSPSPEQGGTQATDRLGRRIAGRISPYITRKGSETDTYKLLEDITDFYLYGTKFKQTTMVPGVDLAHILSKMKNYNAGIRLGFAFIPAAGAFVAGKVGTVISAGKGIHFTVEQMLYANKLMVTDHKKYKAITAFFDAQNDDYAQRELEKHSASLGKRFINSRTLYAPLRGADTAITNPIVVAMTQNWGIKEDGTIVRFTKKGKEKGLYKGIKSIFDSINLTDKGMSIDGLSDEGFKQFRAAVKAVTSETIGNMNPDDIGAVDTNLIINQMMAFKSWMPALIQEYVGGLRWDETTQAMRWGRFKAYLNDYRKDLNFTEHEIEQGRLFYAYTSKVLLPNISKLILDLTTFGLAPRMGMKRVNEERAKKMFLRWRLEHPGLANKVTFDDFLEIKEAQMKAMLMQLRFIFAFMALAMFLGAKGDDGEPRYYENRVTRAFYKIFSKAGSELTFMWNPTEFIRLVKNPWPLTSLLVQVKNTVFNGFDESRDLMFGENSNQDKTPVGYYMLQWMYGAPQLMRVTELYENMKKNPYQVFNTSSQ
jgi:hypothetical protein